VGYAEKRGGKDGAYYRGRYKIGPGNYGTVTDEHGGTIRFRTKREAEKAANDKEAEVRNGKRPVVVNVKVRFDAFASQWYAAQHLAESTMEGYRLAIEAHLLPHFGEMDLDAIAESDVAAWEAKERRADYADSSVRQWRKILHLMLQDATEPPYNLIERNPAAKRRGRGKVAGRSAARSPEKTITDPLGALLLAERAALLTGRDDEFALLVATYYTGTRWGELVGLETRYVRPRSVRVEWQLYELSTGVMTRVPPKDDSYRTIDTPAFLDRLLSDHVARVRPETCDCHGHVYAFRGAHAARQTTRRSGATLADVARLAGVSTGTVSNVLNHPEKVAPEKRERVEVAVSESGFVRGVAKSETAPHWRRSGFATWVFQPAATGLYPAKAPHPERPVPVVGEPWPGVPVRGKGAHGKADACWVPLAPGLTPHGLRHSHKTLMLELGTPGVLMDERLGHADGSVQGRYSHVTREMRERLMEGLTGAWESALDARLGMSPRSAVTVLDRLLAERAEATGGGGQVLRFARAR
jgi:integrase